MLFHSIGCGFGDDVEYDRLGYDNLQSHQHKDDKTEFSFIN